MTKLEDHPLRYQLANELHARPFPSLGAPCRAVFLAIKQPSNAVGRDRDADRGHLLALLDRYGADHPSPGATHFFGTIGKYQLKWESHTEFITYTVFMDGLGTKPFSPDDFEVFPEDWLANAPGNRMTSALVRIEEQSDNAGISDKLAEWFVPESLAVSSVLEDTAVVASDFRIDAAGHMRSVIFVRPASGDRRNGRIVQRVTEIETYKSMSMLGLARVRELSGPMGALDDELSALVSSIGQTEVGDSEATLEALMSIASELEKLIARTSFRFGATGAYEALVNQRIEVLRENRFEGRQTMGEFMMRRFDPAMRTVKATERRLNQLAQRAARAGDLLRTRVDVERSAQNQKLLESMDARADAQLKLQKTVEGFSVAAISYYAVNLLGYLGFPLAEPMGISKNMLMFFLTIPVIIGVFFVVRLIRRSVESA
ncbi:MAG: DUF3422 domain-containing protein [Dinoroseobacter sp.]|nr:DUF3422 domain-containing protein [Dinoroseobacter sp.]